MRAAAGIRWEVFAEQVRDGGINGLSKSLADGNLRGDSRFNSIKTPFREKVPCHFRGLSECVSEWLAVEAGIRSYFPAR